MGAVDLVIQVESPGAVATGLQRVGRAGHQVGAPSRGKLFPKHRADLLEAAVVVERMQAGQIEETHYPRNPLDVLCQQIVAMCALDEWKLDDLARRGARRGTVRRAVRRGAGLGARPARRAATRRRSSPSCDRASCGTASRASSAGRTGAQRLAVTNPGTIPDRGPVHRHAPRRHPRRRARRGDGLREPPRRDVPARRVDLAHRGHHLPEGDRHPGARAAREDAVLARRRPRPPARARPRHRRVHPRAARRRRRRRSRRSGCATAGSTTGRPRTSSPTSTSRPRPPAWCPTTARSSSSGSGTRSATGACACCRRSAPRCTRPGRWPCSTASASGGAWRSS